MEIVFLKAHSQLWKHLLGYVIGMYVLLKTTVHSYIQIFKEVYTN